MKNQSLTNEEMQKRIQELEARNHYLEQILDTLPINIFAKDTQSRYCFTNKLCDEINGVERGALIGKSDFDRNTPEDIAKEYYEDDQRIMQFKKGSRMLAPEYCGNEIHYYEIIKEPIIGDDGNVTGILGMVLNVDSALQASSQQQHPTTVLEDSDADNHTLLFDYNFENEKTSILKPLENFSYFSQSTLKLEDLATNGYIYPDDLIRMQERVTLYSSDAEGFTTLLRFYDDNHELYWCKLSLRIVYDKHMNPIRALGSLNILDESVIEDEKMKLTVEHVEDQMTDILGKRYDAFIFVNEAENYYNIIHKIGILENAKDIGTMEDYIEACKKYIHSDDVNVSISLPMTLENIPGFHKEKGFYSIEMRICDENGDYRWKEVECFPVKDANSNGLVLAILDIDDAVKKRQRQNLKQINNEIIDILSTVVEFRSVESGDHIQRIKGFTKIMLKYANEVYDDVEYTSELIDVISSASAMHDIGKIAIPDGILLKPGKLTPEEFDEMKTHTTKGCDILESMENLQDENYYKYCYEICRHHHERYDGRGYPDGLKGDEIPLEAQIVSVADVYDALISKRVYKDAYSLGEAYEMIQNGECGVFSPKLMECFKLAREDMEAFSREQFGV